jgi:hypothetical protein
VHGGHVQRDLRGHAVKLHVSVARTSMNQSRVQCSKSIAGRKNLPDSPQLVVRNDETRSFVLSSATEHEKFIADSFDERMACSSSGI